MSRAFLDTSAAYALLVASDANHEPAAAAFERLRASGAALVTTSYVLIETYALLSRRVGGKAVRAFRDDLGPLLDVTWVDEGLHDRGLDLVLDRGDAGLSLVDAVSFLAMREGGIDEAFAFDLRFEEEGFALL